MQRSEVVNLVAEDDEDDGERHEKTTTQRSEVVNLVAEDDEDEREKSKKTTIQSFQKQLASCKQEHERRYRQQMKTKGDMTYQSKWKPFYLLQIDDRHITSPKYSAKQCVKFSDLFEGRFHAALLGNFMICLIEMYKQCPRLFQSDVETYFIHGMLLYPPRLQFIHSTIHLHSHLTIWYVFT